MMRMRANLATQWTADLESLYLVKSDAAALKPLFKKRRANLKVEAHSFDSICPTSEA
jgi:hypothetical protein